MLDALATVLVYTLPFLFIIIVLITIHEWGHFYAARTLGIDVSHFSIGMGPVLWSRTDRFGCQWQIAALPIGGYVRFRDETMPLPDGSKPDPSTLMSRRGPGGRAFVVAAGPVINIFVGLLVISTLYVANGRPVTSPVIAEVQSNGPAAQAGLRAGDTVVAINGKTISDYSEIFDAVAMHPDTTVVLDITREGLATPITVAIDIEATQIEMLGVPQTIGRLGIYSGPPVRQPVGAFNALWLGIQDVAQMTKGTVTGIAQVVTGARPLSDMSGPVRMAEMSGNAYKADFVILLVLFAAISINLGVINLLPLPVLDGGHLIFCAIEAVARRPIDTRVLFYIHNVGAALLIAVMVGVTANDIFMILVDSSTQG